MPRGRKKSETVSLVKTADKVTGHAKRSESTQSVVPRGTLPESADAKKELLAGDGPRIIDGFLYFGAKDLLKFELAQHKVVNALQGIGIKKAEIDKAKRDYEAKERLLQIELADLTSLAKIKEQELSSLQKELEATYLLDFSTVTYDDVTGKIMLLGEPVKRET